MTQYLTIQGTKKKKSTPNKEALLVLQAIRFFVTSFYENE